MAASLTMSLVLVKTRPLTYRTKCVIKYDNASILSGLSSEVALMAYDYVDNITQLANDITSHPVMRSDIFVKMSLIAF